MKRYLSLSRSQKRSYTAVLGYANSSGRLEEAIRVSSTPKIDTLSTLLGLPTVANSCYKKEYLSNHPEMTSVVDQLTPSHPSLCNIVSSPDLYEEKGLVTIEHFLVLGYAKSALSILNKPIK